MRTGTVRLYMAEADGATGPLGANSSGVETTMYETVVRPLKKERDFVETVQKAYLKYYIVTVLELQIILESEITAGKILSHCVINFLENFLNLSVCLFLIFL